MNDDTQNETGPIHRFLRRYRESEIIFEEGSLGYEMYLIHSGKVSLSVKQDKETEVMVVVLGLGGLFGEMALVENIQRSVTAVAAEDDTQLIVIDKANFLFIVQHRPEFALYVIRKLCQRLRDPFYSRNYGSSEDDTHTLFQSLWGN